jgi:hypothetical protein
MSLVISPKIGRDGNLLHFQFRDNLGNPLGVSAYTGSGLIVLKNGTPVTLPTPTYNSVAGGLSGLGNIGLLTFFLPTPAIGTDVFTYSATAGWVTAGGLPAPLASLVAVPNYYSATDAVEPDMVVTASMKTMPAGMNVNWPQWGSALSSMQGQVNLVRGLGFPSEVTAFDANGHPTTLSGVSNWTVRQPQQLNLVDSKGTAMLFGTYGFQWDETNPTHPMTISQWSNGTCTNVVFTPGTLVGGVVRQNQLTCTIGANAITQWQPGYHLTITPAAGSTAWTIENEGAIRPGDTFAMLADPFAISTYLVNWLTASNGATPPVLRGMDLCWATDIDTSCMSAADLQQAAQWTWGNGPWVQPTVAQVRAYTPGRSATIYLWDSFGGYALASAPGAPGPYYVHQSVVTWLEPANSSLFSVCEVLFTTPHGIKTGQLPTAPATGMQGVIFTNTTSSFSTTNFNKNKNVAWVTGTESFVSIVGTGQGGTGGLGNATDGQTPGGQYTLVVPDAGSIPPEQFGALNVRLKSQPWWNIPFYCGLDLVTAFATRAMNSTTPGVTSYWEVGNEEWASTAKGTGYCNQLSALLGLPNTFDSWILFAKEAWAAVLAVYTAAGRGAEVERVLGAQWSNPATSAAIVASCNAHACAFDFLALAPYPDDAYNAPSYAAAAAAWPVSSLIDLQRHAIALNSEMWGPGGRVAAHKVSLAAYTQGPIPQICGYEGSAETVAASNSAALCHDINYHPYIYDLITRFLYQCQEDGFIFLCLEDLCMFRQNETIWAMYNNEASKAGRGRSIDANVNQFATAQGGSPGPADGASHDGPDTANPT